MELTNCQVKDIKRKFRQLIDAYYCVQNTLYLELSVYCSLDDTYRVYGYINYVMEKGNEADFIVIQLKRVTKDLIVFETEKVSIKQMNDCIDKAIQYYYAFVNQNT